MSYWTVARSAAGARLEGCGHVVLERKLVLDDNDVYCPIRATLALLGQKWVPHIVHELMSGKRRFNELAHNIGGCNSRTLRDRLKGLEELGVVNRNIVATMPPWVEYELTAKGQQLGEALAELERWGRDYMKTPCV
jgi:DNA-binding HxlR family transcriptional regulator